ncbi:hypothetical protein C8R44DRAFT_743892 [Mycena epipterygia]|nr:hypothetical protein C8R44DRAFT_743892 [Mycena epipterygia]
MYSFSSIWMRKYQGKQTLEPLKLIEIRGIDIPPSKFRCPTPSASGWDADSCLGSALSIRNWGTKDVLEKPGPLEVGSASGLTRKLELERVLRIQTEHARGPGAKRGFEGELMTEERFGSWHRALKCAAPHWHSGKGTRFLKRGPQWDLGELGRVGRPRPRAMRGERERIAPGAKKGLAPHSGKRTFNILDDPESHGAAFWRFGG